MKIRWTLLAVGIAGAAVGFLLNGNSPVGGAIWPPEAGHIQPEGANMALLVTMGVIESLAFGVGCAFLVAAWPWAKSRAAGAWSWPLYVAVAWILMNWVPHTALHMAVGNITSQADYAGLAGIEYGFHFTLILCGLLLATYLVRSALVGAAPRRDAKATASGSAVPRKSA